MISAASVGIVDRVEDAALAAQRPVLGQRPARLAHEPHRHPRRAAAARRHEQRRVGEVGVRCGPIARPTYEAPRQPAKSWSDGAVRRSIDDHPFRLDELPPGEEDIQHLSWAVAISDDYDDAEPRVVLTVEEVGNPGAGLIAHLSPDIARRLRVALRDALERSAKTPAPELSRRLRARRGRRGGRWGRRRSDGFEATVDG